MTLMSKFPGDKYKNYLEYYNKWYKIDFKHWD